MKTKELTDIALRAGEILLVSGAEIYRVEDTIIKIFKYQGIECECFVLLTGIFISTKAENLETITTIKRINHHTFDLKRIELVNAFSRNFSSNTINYEDAIKILDGIEKMPPHKFAIRLAAAGITAFSFALLFKSSIYEGLAALLISIITYYIKEKISELGFFQFFEFFISGIIVGLLSLTATGLFPDLNIYKVIIGAVMILVPGVSLTNGIKDALYGDTVSSLYRFAEVIFIGAAVGTGVGVVLSIGLRFL